MSEPAPEFTLETRECQHCKHYKVAIYPICTKKLMGVIPEMHVNFRTSEGTCWEEPK